MNLRYQRRWTLLGLSTVIVLGACSPASDVQRTNNSSGGQRVTNVDSGAGGGASTYGSTAIGGTAPNVGGVLNGSGGVPNGDGGTGNLGGTSLAANGGSVVGGNASLGGKAAGGSIMANGGNSTGGNTTGVTPSIGGKAFGGSASNGGALAAGGRASTGGATVAIMSAGTTNTAGASGLPYRGISSSTCAERTTLKASWYYNWTTRPDTCTTGGEFVPMVSGKNEKDLTAVTNAITAIANAGYKTVLGFNEPNKSDQANMTVAKVIELWPAMVSHADLRVGSPVTSADAKTWFTDFMTQANAQGLRVDFIALHWYGWNSGSCNNATELENHIKWAEGFNKPLWITEWGCMNVSNPSPEVVAAFYPQAIAMFAKHPRIERYAWYRWNTNNELFDAGALTPLGTAYAAAPAYK